MKLKLSSPAKKMDAFGENKEDEKMNLRVDVENRMGDYGNEITIEADGTAEEVLKVANGIVEKAIRAGLGEEKTRNGERLQPVTEKEELTMGEYGSVKYDVVAIYDNAGIPSFMHRFERISNKELFGGSEKVHPAFIIGGVEYDEIFIAVYEGTMINGKIYSLPFTKPVTNITQDEFAEACFSKGEGWHMVTAVEWGLLANLSLKNGTLPHGNTNYGKYHADHNETCECFDGGKALTGSGPVTWTHNHKEDGVHDLCGNIWEMCRGLRMKDGRLEAAMNNDAALPETNLSTDGADWHPVVTDEGKAIYIDASEGITITDDELEVEEGYSALDWKNVQVEVESEQLKEFALFAGEPDAYCCVDSSVGEFCLLRGGGWHRGGSAGVFYSNLRHARSDVHTSIGGRSAFFKKKEN